MKQIVSGMGATLMWATTAFACPVADDIRAGIVVEFDNDRSSVFRGTGHGRVAEFEQILDAEAVSVYQSDRGLIETGYYELGQGSEAREAEEFFYYDFDIGAIFPMEVGKNGRGVQFQINADGEQTGTANYSYIVKSAEKIRIGDCTYAGFIVDTTYFVDGVTSLVVFTYLPDLEIGMVTGYWSSDGGDAETYTPLQIRAE